MFIPRATAWLLTLALAIGSLAGCSAPVHTDSAAPAVPVTPVVEREVTEFIVKGTTAATQSVEIRPGVSGFIVEQKFKNGADVKKGDVLFVIDPRPFQADLQRAEADLGSAEAAQKLANAELKRATELRAKDALSVQDFDAKAAAAVEAKAAVTSAQAARETARLNLEFSSITAPIGGFIGKPSVSVGSLVSQDPKQDPLATIRALDPIYACAQLDELALLNILRAKAADTESASETRIAMQLPDEDGFQHEGVVDFADNTMDPSTGTFGVWGLFPNPGLIIGAGLAVRVRLPAGTPAKVLLVPDNAVETDANGAFIRVVNADGIVAIRRVKAGAWQADGTRIISGAVAAGDNVVVGSAPALLPGQRVQTVTSPQK